MAPGMTLSAIDYGTGERRIPMGYGPTSADPTGWEWHATDCSGSHVTIETGYDTFVDLETATVLDPCSFIPMTRAKVRYTSSAATTMRAIKIRSRTELGGDCTWTVEPYRTDHEYGWTSTNAATGTCTQYYQWYYKDGQQLAVSPESKEDYLKRRIGEIINARCAPNAIVRNSKRQPLAMPTDIREQRARETLRRVIGDQKFANFIKNGFVTVRAKSGLVYQIFTGHGITSVYDQGRLTERLCVVLNGSFPPTDSLIMRYIMILNNENQFRGFAVKHSVDGYQQKPVAQTVQFPTLVEQFREIKAKLTA